MQSPLVERVYVTPGNGGTGGIARNIPIQADDVVGLAKFAKREKLQLVVLGPDAAVAAGVGDACRDSGIPVFGPGRDAGRIESSKAYAKDVMRRAGIPTAAFEVFSEPEPAKAWAREHGGRVAVKADGLALGKGVLICRSPEEADAAVDAMLVQRRFGSSGRTIVVEELLDGPELSVFGLTDGQRVVTLAPSRDYKRAREGDEGPNTGGMGAYSPPVGVDGALLDEIARTVLEPAVRTLAEDGHEYRGVLYAGLMLTSDGPRCLEFNARFGDPETQVVLPRLRTDLVALMLKCARGELDPAEPLDWDPRAAVGIVVASGGYPEAYETGFPIVGLTALPAGVMVFHAGTKFSPADGLVTAGGRVLTCVGLGESVDEARLVALSGAVRVGFPGAYFRRDIAQEAV
jgi:phosphoribosylamine---glycine ligase